jgi:16S rRNA processing protein RimM
MSDRYIYLGYCSAPHGIKGAMTLVLENEDASTLAPGSKIFLKKNDQFIPYKLKDIQIGHKVMASLEGIADRTQLEQLLPFEIWIDRADLPEVDADEFYLNDLVGAKVLDLNKNEIGSVLRFYSNGVQDIIVIRTQSEEIELPLIENFFPEINPDENYIVMITPEVIE